MHGSHTSTKGKGSTSVANLCNVVFFQLVAVSFAAFILQLSVKIKVILINASDW